VAYVLEGSVRKSVDHLRVTAQLIDSRTGTHLFSQTYARNLSDVLKMQDEIAASIVRALQIEVSYGLVPRPALRSSEAYNVFLLGLHAINGYNQQGFEQAASYFQRALELDPVFANAAAGLSVAYDNLGEYYYMPAPEAFEKARRAAELALKLDPNHAIAHAMLGNIHVVYDWDWPAADREFKVALDLAPNDSVILLFAGQHSLIVGRWDEALKLLNASLERDPLNPSYYFVLNMVQSRRGRLAEAETAMRRTLEISPAFSFAHYDLGVVLLARGQAEAALAETMKEADERGRAGGSTMAYFALGRKADSDAALVQWLKYANELPFSSAEIHGYRGELDEAFKWLDRAYVQKDAGVAFIKGDPLLKNIEGDPRYKAFLKKMNLPE
jgi:tetratricopeptide (TPR) repeat protein